MLEPVATVIFNTVLSAAGRSHLERSIPLPSVVKIVQSIPTRPLTSNFFNPQPKRVKGKARGVGSLDDEFEPTVLSLRCREWSVQTRSSIVPFRRNHSVMRDASKQKRAIFSKPPFMPAHRNQPNPRIPTRLSQTLVQKRHSSQMADDSPDNPFSVASSSSGRNGVVSLSTDVKSETAIQRFLASMKNAVFDPDEAWSMYTDVEQADALSKVSVPQLLTFTDKLCHFGDASYNSKSIELSQLFLWGERVKGLLDNLASRIAPLSAFDHWSRCSMARANALMGQVDESLALIHSAQKIPLEYEKDVRILWTYKTLVFYIFRYYDASHVLTMLAKEWLSVGSFLLKSSGQWHYGKTQYVGSAFRKTVQRLLARIPRPAILISSHFTQWGPELSRRIGELLIESYVRDQLPLHALDTFNQLKKLKVAIPLDTQLSLIRALVKEDTLDLAKDLFNTIPRGTTYTHYLQTALHLFAHRGDVRRAESYFNALHQQSVKNPRDIAMLMHAYATSGQAEKVRVLFDQFFPVQDDGNRDNKPDISHFGVAMYACARSGQIAEINYWLEEMVKAGHRPNTVVYNTIMQAFARTGDMASLRAVLDQLKTSETPPTVITYQQLMTTLAHRKDVAGVEALYKEAVEERGIVPNRRLVNTLMNAHVNAGSWQGVIRVFDYIHSDPHPRIRFTIELYTTLIKAYVLIGAPFSVISKIFSRLEDLDVKPDSYMYSLLIQSACDAGEMRVASEIYREMDRLAQQKDSNIYIDVYILTIIMAGYLRAGKRKEAQAIYEEMATRQIQPTAVTFNVMLNSYANQRSQEALAIAENFVNELTSTPERPWAAPVYGKPSALELVYGPLLKGHSVMGNAEAVEKLHEKYFEDGGVETLGTLSALFDAYRRTFQIEKVKEMWPAIFTLGLEYVRDRPMINPSEEDPSANRLLNNILCLPLSIYIDALSAAGEHEEIAHVWKGFQEQKFSFDAHNWNHLAVALIRAGQLERAFQIVENVILPYQDQAQELIASRDTKPKSPLMYGEKEEVDSTTLNSQAQLKHPASKRRALIQRNQQQAVPQIDSYRETETYAKDLAFPMHVLHQISPAWNVWKIHSAVMSVFLRALENLREGYFPRPVQPRGDTNSVLDLPDREEFREEAKELFRRLYEHYPRTCELLHSFERSERRRLGEVYGRKYEFGGLG